MQKIFSSSNENLADIVLKRAKDSISTELDGETVILNIETGVYNGLDPVGTTIWNVLENPASFERLTAAVLDEYEVTRGQCIDDLCTFLSDLLKNKLIEICDETPA